MGAIGAAKTLAGLPGSISGAASGISGAASGISGAASGLAGGIGEAASGIGGALAGAGSSMAEALPLLLLAHGGSVPREHHADGDTVGNPDGSAPDDGYLAAVKDLINRAGTNMARGWNDAGDIAQKAIHPGEVEGPPAPTSREIEAMQRAKYTGPDAARVAPGISLVMPPSDTAPASAGLSPSSAPVTVGAGAGRGLAPTMGDSPAEESVVQPVNAPLPPRRPAGLAPLPTPIDVNNNTARPVAATPQSFEDSFRRTLGFEGGYSPRDANGYEVNKGINAKWHPDVDIKNLTDDQARAIYKNEYWDAIGADNLDPKIRGMAFDTAVIAGPAKAKELLRQSGGDPQKFMELRSAFQNDLVNSNPEKYGRFAKAWDNRNAALAGGEPPRTRLAMADTGTQNDAGFLSGLGGAGKTISDIGGGVAGAAKGTGDWFKSNQEWLVPLLKGVGTMASSPSRYLGAALLQGIGGGASAYAQQQKQQADIGLTGAQTGQVQAQSNLTRAQTAKTAADTVRGSVYNAAGRDWVSTVDGKPMLLGDYLNIPEAQRPPLLGSDAAKTFVDRAVSAPGINATVAPATAPAAPAAPATAPAAPAIQPAPTAPAIQPAPTTTQSTPFSIGDRGASQIDQDYSFLTRANSQALDLPRRQSAQTEQGIIESANASATQGANLNQMTSEILSLPSTGMIQGGPLNGIRQAVIERVNDVARTSEHPEWQINQNEIASSTAIDKLSALAKFSNTSGAGQHSLAALQAAEKTIPSTAISKAEAVEILAGLYSDKQRALDQARYLQEYKSAVAKKYSGTPDAYLAQNAQQAFRQDHPDEMYLQEKEQIKKMLREAVPVADGKFIPVFSLAASGKYPANLLEKRYGQNVSRYIRNQ